MVGALGELSIPENPCVHEQLKVTGARGSQAPAPPEGLWTAGCDWGEEEAFSSVCRSSLAAAHLPERNPS